MSDTNDKLKQKRAELDQKRKEHGEREMDMLRSNFWKKKEIEDRKRFERQTATESLLDFQYQSDNSLIFDLFVNWQTNAKTEKQKETIMTSIRAILRMQSYVHTLQTTSKLAVSNMLDEQRRTSQLLRKVNELEKENKYLKAEVKYYEQSK